MPDKKREPSARERWGEWVIIIVLILVGFTLIFASISNHGLLQEALATIGLNFLSSAAVTTIILLLVGNSVAGLKNQIDNLGYEVDKLHNIIDEEIDAIYNNIGRLSTLLNDAGSLGIIGIGRSRHSNNFEGNKSFVER